MRVISLLLFVISMIGHGFYLEKKTELKIEFLPIISISLITSVLFIASILNILLFTAYVLFFIGLYFFCAILYSKRREKDLANYIIQYITPGILLFVVMGIFYLFLFRGQRLIHYDNFSHWGTVVKNIFLNNRLPNIENAAVRFNSYPPGSALFIYYFMKIVGASESLALYAQMIILLTGLLSLFSFSSFRIFDVKNEKMVFKKLLLFLITVFISIYLLAGPSPIQDLLVDTLLNVLGISLFSLIFYYYDSPNKIYVPVSLIAIFLTLIKNSGMFFVYFALFFYAISLFSYSRTQKLKNSYFLKKELKLLFPFVAPILAFELWKRHVSLVFPSYSLGKHTMSLEIYKDIFNSKTIEEIIQISQSFIQKIFDPYLVNMLVLILIIISLVAFKRIALNKKDKKLFFIGMIGLLTFLFYSFGLWVMYLVSMPQQEALNLSSFDRYMITIMNYIIGIISIGLIHYLDDVILTKKGLIPFGLLMLFFGYLTLNDKYIEDTKKSFQNIELLMGTDEPTLKNIDVALSNLPSNPMISSVQKTKYYIYFPNEHHASYARYFIRYRFNNNNPSVNADFDDLEKFWEHDYLTISIVNDQVVELFRRYSAEIPEVNTYRLDSENKQILK